ncbi:MAG: metallophosphoesterase [Clostridia bacterium]|nr:metallophosphoesterase [Clostridia bacterium]
MTKILAVIFALLTAVTNFGVTYPEGYTPATGAKAARESFVNKEERTATAYVGEADGEPWSPDDEYLLSETAVLEKDPEKDFVILNFSDMHFSDYDYRAWTAFPEEATMRRLVNRVQPDLITLTGDLVCGDDSTYYSIHRLTDLMESFGVPWAPVFGNHDDEANCDRNYLADVMTAAPHCLMKKSDPEMGVGNYIVNIAEPTADGGQKIVESLIFMDSHKTQPNEKQKAWFTWAADGINALTDNGAEISLFMHIPLPEYRYAYDLAWNAEEKKWNEGFDAYGALHETICCERDADGQPVQRGFFDAVKAAGTAKFVFCGHEHMNNFSILYEGVRLTYCMKVGKASGYQPGFDGGTEIYVGAGGVSRIVQDTVSFGPVVKLADIRV